MDADIYRVRCGLMDKAPDFGSGYGGSSPVMVGRAPKFLGALKVVPKLVASGSGKKTGRGKKTT